MARPDFDQLKGIWASMPKAQKATILSGAGLGAAAGGYGAHKARKEMTPKERREAPGVIAGSIGGALTGGYTGSTLAGTHRISSATGKRRYFLAPLATTAAGAAAGAAHGYRGAKKHNERKAKGLFPNHKTPKQSPLGRAASGALGGAMLGSQVGAAHSAASYLKHVRLSDKAKAVGRTAPGSKIPDWLSGAGTKAEAKKRYREQAIKFHPDKASNTAEAAKHHKKFQEISSDWNAFQKSEHFDKLSALRTEIIKSVSKPSAGEAPKAAKKGWSWLKKNFRPRKLKYHALTNHALHGTVGGAATGGSLGAAGGFIAQPDRSKGETRKKNALKGAATGAVLGGVVGHAQGRAVNEARKLQRHMGGAEVRRGAREAAYRNAEKAKRQAEYSARQKQRSAAHNARSKAVWDKYEAETAAWRKQGRKGPAPKAPPFEMPNFEMPPIDFDMGDILHSVHRDMRAEGARAGVAKFFNKKKHSSAIYFTPPLVGGLIDELTNVSLSKEA